MSLFSNIRQYIKFWLLAFFISPVFLWLDVNAANDILWQVVQPSNQHGTILHVWENVKTVWNNVLNDGTEIWIWKDQVTWKNTSSIIVKIIKILLILTITLSITMILYNGMRYIIEVWNGKDGKSLLKNVAFIVIWILVAIFSVTILNLIRSVPNTLQQELQQETNNKTDNNVIWSKEQSLWDYIKWKQ